MQATDATPEDPGHPGGSGLWAARLFPSRLQLPAEVVGALRESGFELKVEADGRGLEASLRGSRDGLLLIYPPEMTEPAWRILPMAVGLARAAGWHCAALVTGEETLSAERLAAAGLDEAWLAGASWNSVARRASQLKRERGEQARGALFAQAVELAPCAVTIADFIRADQPLIYANAAFRKMTGFSDEDAIGRNCRFLQGDKRDDTSAAFLRDALRAGKPVRTILTNYRKNGQPFKNRLSLRPVRDAAGQITHYIGFQEDVTTRLNDQREARLKQAEIDAATNVLPIKVWTTDLETKASRYNQAWDEVFGPAALQNSGTPPDWRERISFEDQAAVEAALDQATKFGGRVGFDARLRMAGGDECWHHFVVVAHSGDEAERGELVGAAWDTSQAHATREEFSQNLGQLSLRLFVIRQAVQKANAGAAALLAGSLPAAIGELLRCGSLRLARLTSGRRLELQPAGAWDGDEPVFTEGTFLTCRLEDLLGEAGTRLPASSEPVALPVAAVARLGGRSGSEVVAAPAAQQRHMRGDSAGRRLPPAAQLVRAVPGGTPRRPSLPRPRRGGEVRECQGARAIAASSGGG